VWVLLAITGALGAALGGCSGCEEQDAQAVIRQRIEAAIEHAERHAVSEIMDLATDGLVVEPGSIDRRQVAASLVMVFRQFREFEIHAPRPSIDLDASGKRATAQLPFVVSRDGRERADLDELGDDPQSWVERLTGEVDFYNLQLWWVLDDGQWRVHKARIRGTRGIGGMGL